MKAVVAVALAIACGKAATTTSAPPPTASSSSAGSFDPTASLDIASDEVELAVGASKVGATITHPTRAGRYPAIVVIAGSGPTDRDWNSPLLKAKNGSGKLLADAIAKHGAVVLRFDKPGTGKNTTPIADVTIDTYRDEAAAGLAALRARDDVDGKHVLVAGHSEGGIHAIRTALVEKDRIAGVILLSSAGRAMADIMYGQVEKQLRAAMPQLADAELATFRKALDDVVAGRPVDAKKASTLPPLQQLVAQIASPQNGKVAAALLGIDPGKLVGDIAVPVFVYNGKKDIQVDPELDAGRLERALRDAHRDVTIFLAPEANHVLKHETKTLDQIRADLQTTVDDYNSPAIALDDATVAAISAWIAKIDR